jgi:hypothetical protein
LEIFKSKKVETKPNMVPSKTKKTRKKKLGPKVPFEIRNCTTPVYTFTLGLEVF